MKECDCDMVVKGEGFDTMIALAKKQYKMFEELSDVCFLLTVSIPIQEQRDC